MRRHIFTTHLLYVWALMGICTFPIHYLEVRNAYSNGGCLVSSLWSRKPTQQYPNDRGIFDNFLNFSQNFVLSSKCACCFSCISSVGIENHLLSIPAFFSMCHSLCYLGHSGGQKITGPYREYCANIVSTRTGVCVSVLLFYFCLAIRFERPEQTESWFVMSLK